MTVVRVSVEPIRNPGVFSSQGDMEVVTFVQPARVGKVSELLRVPCGEGGNRLKMGKKSDLEWVCVLFGGQTE